MERDSSGSADSQPAGTSSDSAGAAAHGPDGPDAAASPSDKASEQRPPEKRPIVSSVPTVALSPSAGAPVAPIDPARTAELTSTPGEIWDLAAMYEQALSGGMATASLGATEQVSERELKEALGSRVEQYELIRPLGSGGMGHVFLARDTRLGRLVALKFLTDRDSVQAERFATEARATASFNHDNVVVIYEIGEHRGYPFMALEYVQGQTLEDWLDERRHRQLELARYRPNPPDAAKSAGESVAESDADDPAERSDGDSERATDESPEKSGEEPGEVAASERAPVRLLVPPSRAAELIIPVVRALVSAHEKNIVHRDLKPANVMLADSGAIKVLDFGIAKMLTQAEIHAVTGHWDQPSGLASMARAGVGSMTRAGTVVGTLPYMSPEQLRAGQVDHRTDIWAVGIMLYQLVMGKHPLAPLSGKKLQMISNVAEPMPRVSDAHPELGELGPIIDRCLLKPLEDRTSSAGALLAELEALVSRSLAGEVPDAHSPFAGLSAFQRSDAERFFGRDRDIASMVARLRHQQMVAVVGPSGAGKSSFVRAGVIPALERSGDGWAAFIVRPGRNPLMGLAEIIERISTRSTTEHRAPTSPPEMRSKSEWAALLRTQPGYLGARLRSYARQKLRRILVFVDQFEELYTLTDGDDERACFARCLDGVADDASSPLRVVVSLRSDFLDRVADESGAMREVIRGLLWLQPIGRDGMRAALVKPVERVGHRFESKALVESMLDTLEHMRVPLPLLEFTAAKLWELRDRAGRVLTESSYAELGGIEGALAAHADGVMAGFSTRQRQLARAIFLQLVTPERTRAIVRVGELHELIADGDAVETMVDQLASARLLHIETGDERAGAESTHGHPGASVELMHESLISRWPTLRQWLDETQENSLFLDQLSSAAKQWDNGERADGFLWTGRAARDAERWHRRWSERGSPQGELGKRDEEYLTAVVALAARARRRRRGMVLGAFAAVVAIAIVLSVLVVRANRTARLLERQARATENEAAHARNAARLAAALAHLGDPTTVLVLLREAEQRWLPQRWSELVQQALNAGVARVVLAHPDRVHKAMFSPDGSRIVSACWDGNVRVFNADGTGAPVILRGHTNIVNSAEFSPDGKRVVSASYDRTIRIWNADGTGEPVILRGHTGVATWATFSPDGAKIASGSHDRSVRIWSADGTGAPQILIGHEDAVLTVEFSRDGRRLVSSSYDKTVRVWTPGSGQPPLVLTGHTDRVHSASFSPDGDRIASAAYDKTIRIWNADGSEEPRVLTGHDDFVNSAAFSPDGTRLVSAADDQTVRVWNLAAKGPPPVVLRGHQHRVISAYFHPDGGRVVTASFSKAVRVWDVELDREPQVLSGHGDRVNMATYSPDGRLIASTSDDYSVRVWNAADMSHPVILRGHTDFVRGVVFSPDSRRLATVAKDGTVRVWRVDGGSDPVVFPGYAATHGTVVPSFSPDSNRIVAADGRPQVAVHRTDRADQPIVLQGHKSGVLWAEFSPADESGYQIATASKDHTARIYSLEAGAEPTVLAGHTDEVLAVRFSPDGQRLITRARDNTVRVWTRAGRLLSTMSDYQSPPVRVAISPLGDLALSVSASHVRLFTIRDGGDSDVRRLQGHEDRVDWAEFSPDGTRVVTASKDKTARVWAADSGRPILILRSPDEVNTARFSPDGQRIVLASDDHTASVWSDLEPVRFGDPRVWTATSYCMSEQRRQKLLGVTSAQARANRADCLRRVRAGRVTPITPITPITP